MSKSLEKIWTDDFSKFREKVETILGNIENLAKEHPNIYAHQVLSHGFMEYAGIRSLFQKTHEKVREENHALESNTQEYTGLYWDLMKKEYLTWARQNNLPEKLLEVGWEEFRND